MSSPEFPLLFTLSATDSKKTKIFHYFRKTIDKEPMETKSYNSFKFFQAYFNIPQRIKLEWCIVKECPRKERAEIRLGIALNERLYIDVANRRFFTCLDAPYLQRCIYPADRINEIKRHFSRLKGNFSSLKNYSSSSTYPGLG